MQEPPKRRWFLGLLAVFALFVAYRVFAVYTVRSGECRPKPVDPELRNATRDERGVRVTYPERVGFPPQQRPLVVMTYNIAGHDQLWDGDHIREIAAIINDVKPDIVGLQEVHRRTWQARFRDQLAELVRLTGMRGYFAPSYEQWGGGFGNAILTRGEVIAFTLHELPSMGEPRAVVEATIRLDRATISFYVTHLTTWGSLLAGNREEQLACLARHVRTSRWPYILAGDLNAPPDATEILRFRKENAAQLCGENLGATHALTNRRLDYIFADYGFEVRAVRVLARTASDHYPVIAELMWQRAR